MGSNIRKLFDKVYAALQCHRTGKCGGVKSEVEAFAALKEIERRVCGDF